MLRSTTCSADKPWAIGSAQWCSNEVKVVRRTGTHDSCDLDYAAMSEEDDQ